MVGVTLVGNHRLADLLQSDERYELIESRTGFWTPPAQMITVEDVKTLWLELSQHTLKIDDTDKWWIWLHKRVEGNARILVESVLPALLQWTTANAGKTITQLTVNQVFAAVLNKSAV
jgi:hypothetical protein